MWTWGKRIKFVFQSLDMAEHLKISKGNKREKYELLFEQVKYFAENETDIIALMANVTSMIHYTFGFLWTGFYRVVDSELVLGPFQGPLACTRIKYGKGVCGTAWEEGKTIMVRDVNDFKGHIACSSDSRSEIVVPFKHGEEVFAVLDIDSREVGSFDEEDALWLERIAKLFNV